MRIVWEAAESSSNTLSGSRLPRSPSSGGKITLLPDLSPAEHFAVLAHEVAHELLHKSERRKKTTPRVREREAEAVAFVVSSAVGVNVGTASSDYIQMYDGDKERFLPSR